MSFASGMSNDRLLTGSFDHTLRAWDTRRGICEQIFVGHTAEVSAVAITYDGSTAASVSVDRTCRTWRIADGECLATLRSVGML